MIWLLPNSIAYLFDTQVPNDLKPTYPALGPIALIATTIPSLILRANTHPVSTSYAHSARWPHQRQGQVLPVGGPNRATLQVLDLNTGTTTPLRTDGQGLLCVVFEGRGIMEVILQDTPVFTISRGGHWSVAVGKECRVRNPNPGSKAMLT